MLKIPIMTDAPALTRENPILAKFRAALAETYGDRLERVVLFGSRARGDAQPDSDYDVAVFLNGMNAHPTVGLNSTGSQRCGSNSLMKPALSSTPNPIRLARTASAPRSCTKSGARGWTCDPGSCTIFTERR
jgi:predicted nucleotidyltransferase